MRAHFGLPSVSNEEDKKDKPPITVKFEIPYFTVSGIQVRYLKIIEKSGYQARCPPPPRPPRRARARAHTARRAMTMPSPLRDAAPRVRRRCRGCATLRRCARPPPAQPLPVAAPDRCSIPFAQNGDYQLRMG